MALVTVATFFDEIEAQIAKGKLESCNIDSCVDKVGVISVYGLLSNAAGVKLKVKESDAQRAIEILREEPIRLPLLKRKCKYYGHKWKMK